MTDRPSVAPALIGGLADLVPARLRRRLDENPMLAESWTWTVAPESVSVSASSDAEVTLEAPGSVVMSMAQVHCTCLLAPRCLHVAAVLLCLPVSSDSLVSDAPTLVDAALLVLKPEQRNAASQAWSAGAALLDAGASGAGLLLTSELLRAVHSCRDAGVHRVAAAGLRVAQRLRDLQAQRPQFRLEALASDLADLLTTARALRTAHEVQPESLGTARRAYAPVGSLRVSGLFTEAVVSAAGYSGVVTYVCDRSGRIWSLGDVVPGPPERCQLAYASPVDLGDASLDHRALGREGLHLQGATASVEGRLGSGRTVHAVRAPGSAWTEEPLAHLWGEPLEAQLDRAWSARSASARRAGSDLVFVRGVVRGVRADALELALDDGLTIAGLAASDHAELQYRANLALLGSAPGLPLLVVGRVVFGRPRALVLLAVAPVEGEDVRLEPPSAWAGRVNLGLDTLQHANIRAAASGPVALPSIPREHRQDPLDPLRRRALQVVSGGRSAVSEPAFSGLARDEAALGRAQLVAAAQVLRALRAAGSYQGNAETRREHLARAWLVGWSYLSAASARLQRLSWTLS